jgi:hypothetical protein
MYGDPNSIFLPVQDAPFEKTLGGHPDVQYSFAPVRGDRRYKIKGRRGDEAYLAFTLHRGAALASSRPSTAISTTTTWKRTPAAT